MPAPYQTTSHPFGIPGLMMRDVRMGLAGALGEMMSPNANVKGRRIGEFRDPVGPMVQQMLPQMVKNQLPKTPGLNQNSLLTALAFKMGG